MFLNIVIIKIQCFKYAHNLITMFGFSLIMIFYFNIKLRCIKFPPVAAYFKSDNNWAIHYIYITFISFKKSIESFVRYF